MLSVKSAVLMIAALLSVSSIASGRWRGLEDERHISGPKLTEADLAGKVVLVDRWGIFCPPCRSLLPEMAKCSESFKHKPFVVVGSHCQQASFDEIRAVISQAKVKFSVYQDFGLSQGEPQSRTIPFMYVVDRCGRVIYSGSSPREALEAAIDSFSSYGRIPENLVEGLMLNHYKTYASRFKFGKNVTTLMKKVAKDSESKNERLSSEAAAIVKSIGKTKDKIKEEIEFLISTDPPKACDAIVKFIKTWPEEGRMEYAEKLSRLQASVKKHRQDSRKRK